MIKCPYCNGIGKKVDKVKNGDRVIAVVYVCKAKKLDKWVIKR